MKTEFTRYSDRFKVTTPYSPALVSRFRCLPGAQYHHETKQWSFPFVKDVLLMVCDCCGMLPWMLGDDFRQEAGEHVEQNLNAIALDMSVLEGHHWHTEPFAHQRRNVARLIQNKRWLLADEMGTGKSFAIANILFRIRSGYYADQIGNVLIVCPKSVLNGWQDQLEEHAGLGGGSFIYCGSNKQAKIKSLFNYTSVLIANYEAVRENITEFEKVNWNTIILDEIHKVKNFTAKTSKAIRCLTAKAERVYGLSGTPAPNGLEDWFGVLSAIDPNLLPVQTKTGFEARYCIKARVGDSNIFKISGYRNTTELHGYIARITSRVTKAECLDLPPKVFSVRKVQLEGEQARIYRELKKDAVARLTALKGKNSGMAMNKQQWEQADTLTVNNVLTESLRLLQVVGGFIPSDDGVLHEIDQKAKVDALADLLDEAGPKQVVIWCAFRPEVAFLDHWLDKHYGPVSVLTGETTSEERAAAIEAFRTGKTRYFIGTSAGGEGVNGLSVADTEIFYSRTWNLKDYLQQQDRLHRIGQERTVNIINLVAVGTVDERVSEALEKKASLQEMMLRNPEEFL